ncbi:MAG TPA: hypothetical protein VK155_10370 [Bacteroidales bacterium]|nr:hypothetical protein [Bacteroidales bacterium]
MMPWSRSLLMSVVWQLESIHNLHGYSFAVSLMSRLMDLRKQKKKRLLEQADYLIEKWKIVNQITDFIKSCSEKDIAV